jgi:hypothetical protein
LAEEGDRLGRPLAKDHIHILEANGVLSIAHV